MGVQLDGIHSGSCQGPDLSYLLRLMFVQLLRWCLCALTSGHETAFSRETEPTKDREREIEIETETVIEIEMIETEVEMIEMEMETDI